MSFRAWRRAKIVHHAIQVATNSAELPRINHAIPVVGVAIAIEAALNILVRYNSWCIVSTRQCVGRKVNASTNVVGMSVCVHQCSKRSIGPSANGFHHLFAGVLMAGVETHQAIPRVPCDHVAE